MSGVSLKMHQFLAASESANLVINLGLVMLFLLSNWLIAFEYSFSFQASLATALISLLARYSATRLIEHYLRLKYYGNDLDTYLNDLEDLGKHYENQKTGKNQKAC